MQTRSNHTAMNPAGIAGRHIPHRAGCGTNDTRRILAAIGAAGFH